MSVQSSIIDIMESIVCRIDFKEMSLQQTGLIYFFLKVSIWLIIKSTPFLYATDVSWNKCLVTHNVANVCFEHAIIMQAKLFRCFLPYTSMLAEFAKDGWVIFVRCLEIHVCIPSTCVHIKCSLDCMPIYKVMKFKKTCRRIDSHCVFSMSKFEGFSHWLIEITIQQK